MNLNRKFTVAQQRRNGIQTKPPANISTFLIYQQSGNKVQLWLIISKCTGQLHLIKTCKHWWKTKFTSLKLDFVDCLRDMTETDPPLTKQVVDVWRACASVCVLCPVSILAHVHITLSHTYTLAKCFCLSSWFWQFLLYLLVDTEGGWEGVTWREGFRPDSTLSPRKLQVTHLTQPNHNPFTCFICVCCIVISVQSARAAYWLFQPQTASLSRYAGLKPPPLPVQLNANIHQSPLHSPLSSSLLCARACCTVGLIRPLLFTRVKQTTQWPGRKSR